MFTVKVHAIEQSEQTIDAMLRNVVKSSSSEEIQEEDGSNGDAHVADEEAEEDKEATAVGISGTAVETGDAAAAAAADGGCDGTRIIKFSSGNPRVEATRGVMHLFRDTSVDPGSLEHLPVGRSEQLCVLAVPNHMTGADFCQFTGAFIENIKEMRFVRNDGVTDRYSVLMKFDSQGLADDFYRHYNLKPFSSMEAEVCHVVFTADVQYTESGEQASIPPSGLTELPTCPVCLERLDQHISGILTTVCNHSFHSYCISKWTDSSCPVCRYCQQQSEKSTCSVCGTSENLWICVICGFVGCGRYKEGHAVNHWKESQHCYSLDLETQRVWDYVGDGYVHRLIQSKTDGKLVELPAPCRDGSDDCSSCEAQNQREDMDAAIYSSKLDAYYEGRLAEMEEDREAAIQHAVEGVLNHKMRKLQARCEKVEMENRDLKELNKSLTDNQKLYQQRIKEVEEREQKETKERDARIADLEDQVRDLMVFIEAQRALETTTGGAEIRDGTVLALPANVSPSTKSNGRSLKAGKKKK
ncbi:hypothetical protein CY35_13G010200 [Sphagnum magellanicum]|nr:hypothetical protein CY35_13G010200 [Sphagnum magellanicum]